MSEAFNRICDAISSGHNVFISGVGGCGKTYLLRLLHKHFTETYKKLCVLTSTTGISAYNLGGKTLHSWTRIILPSDANVNAQEWADNLIKRLKYNQKLWKSYRQVEILFIDEVSMLGSKYMDALNYVCQSMRDDERPMGGIQVVLGGDMMQLPPVRDEFCFESGTWVTLNLKYFRMTKAYRFTNQLWVDVLQRARLGELTKGDQDILQSRVGVRPPKDCVQPIYLASRNEDVDVINQKHMNRLQGQARGFGSNEYNLKVDAAGNVIDAQRVEQLPKEIASQFMIDRSLVLKVKCEVMLLSNLSVESGLTNGTRGIVVDLRPDAVTVHFENGIVQDILPYLFKIEHNYKWYGREGIPLKLAFATSIHKSQSLTLSSVELDIGSNVFTQGQSYVALSRCKSLEGLYIRDIDVNKVRPHPTALRFERHFLKKCIDV
jgi:ATP-dependent DNA helicase PIF1